MADVTGRTYEAFTEFLLRKLNYRDEWTEGNSPQYFYEKHPKALCHENKGICKNSYECHEFSKANGIPFGPWYDPDFFIMRNNLPLAALHVSHWSNPMASQLKFWRTIEDHFQYKINFGRNFLSINLVFVALDTNEVPTLVKDSKEIIKLQGWKPAVGSAFAVSFDSSILFPVNYYPLEQFEKLLPKKIPSLSRKKRELFNSIWETLYKENEIIKKSVKKLVTILNNALTSNPNQRYTKESIHKLQDVCWNGRKKTINIHHTFSRYRNVN